MLNKILLQGRMVNDPETRTANGDTTVVSFRIACERDFKSRDGEKATDFISVTAWRQTAEFISKYFNKGRMILLEGRLQMREFTDKEGNRRIAAEVVADNAYFCDSPGQNSGGGDRRNQQQPARKQSNRVNTGYDDVEEELPF